MATQTSIPDFRAQIVALLPRWWPLLFGLALMFVPTLASLATQVWTDESGVHGPIVIATGLWLMVRAFKDVKALIAPGVPAVGYAGFGLSLLGYVFGRSYGFISLEVAGLLAAMLSIAYLYVGGEVLKKLWFPIFYLAFVIPLPGWFVDDITGPLKTYVSWGATELLSLANYPIARSGVTLYVDQYELLVEDACAGLNSIVSLTAIGLFYIYLLHNTSWKYALFLFLWILPAALLANLVRVIILVLITYYMGNEAAQGFLHSTAGLIMFVTALLGVFLVDKLMTPLRRRLSGTSA